MKSLVPSTSFNYSYLLRRLKGSSYVASYHVAVQFRDRQVSYNELYERVARLANALQREGFRKGDRVAVLLKNDLAWFDVFFALSALGGVLVPINFFFTAKEVAFVLNDAGATTLVAGTEFAKLAAEALTEAKHCKRIITVPVGRTEPASIRETLPGSQDLSDFEEQGEPKLPEVSIEMAEPALIQYTSGTTGFPKGATHSVSSLLWNSFHQIGDFQITQSECYLCVPSLCWIAGLHDFTLATLWVGGTVIVNPSGGLTIDKLLDTIERERVTSVLLVPTILKQLVDFPELHDRDLSSLKWILTGAEPVPVPVIERFNALLPEINLLQGYGLSEGPSIATCLRPADALRKVGSCGKALTNCELRVVDDEDTDMPAGQPGEVILRSPANMVGYWGREEATEETLRKGWLHTGDLGIVDEEGYLTICGRKKDMFISGGLNVYPAEIESVILSDEHLAECAVVAMPDDRWGEVGLAVVVAKTDADVDLAGLRDRCKNELAKYKIPKEFVISDEPLPRTASGKVQKFKVREQFLK